MKKRIFQNNTKIDQTYYTSRGDPFVLKPGQTREEDITYNVSVYDLIKREKERIMIEEDAEKLKEAKKRIAQVKVAKETDLEKFKENETRPQVLEAILEREKEIVNASKRGQTQATDRSSQT